MHASAWSLTRVSRPFVVVILVVTATIAGSMGSHVAAADPSGSPVTSAAPVPAEAPKTMCESASDLRLYVGFLKDQSLREDGIVPVLVGAVASLSEARTLAGLVGETYRPLVDDLIVSLQSLQGALRGFRDQPTVGAGLVQLGESISGIGVAMDALSVALSGPCPD